LGTYRHSRIDPFRTRIQHPSQGWSWIREDRPGVHTSTSSAYDERSVATRFRV
jgi:hypothetical protein